MSKKWEQYEVSGETLVRKNRFCPRCGEGVFMAEHSNRFSCGSCGYTEWKEGKDRIEPKPAPKPEVKEEKPAEKPKEVKEEEKPEEAEEKPEEKKEEKPAEKPKEKPTKGKKKEPKEAKKK
jgi:small subunit ribosomal protein S27Ae